MVAIFSDNWRRDRLKDFKTTLGNGTYYFGVGKSESFIDENDNFVDIEIPHWNEAYLRDVKDSVQAIKKIKSTNISESIPRYNWKEDDTSVVAWDDADDEITNKKFYVFNENNDSIYKCINKGSEPTANRPVFIRSDTLEQTPDGYTWKYMFTLSTSQIRDFLSSPHLPVDDSTQKYPSVDGAIYRAVVVNGGSGYNPVSTLITSDGSGSVIVPTVVGGEVIKVDVIRGGTGHNPTPVSGNSSTTLTYADGSNSSDARFVPLVNSAGVITSVSVIERGNGYHDTPVISVDGNGTGARLVATAANGQIDEIYAAESGNNYTRAKLNIAGSGSGASARAVLSPSGGHGSNLADELGAFYIVVNATITGGGAGDTDFLSIAPFHQGVILKPSVNDNDTYSTLKYMVVSGSFSVSKKFVAISSGGELLEIYDNFEKKRAIVDSVNYYSSEENAKTGGSENDVILEGTTTATHARIAYHQNFRTGYVAFTTSDRLNQNNSTINNLPITFIGSPEVDISLLNVDYVDNTRRIERIPGQTEELRIIWEF